MSFIAGLTDELKGAAEKAAGDAVASAGADLKAGIPDPTKMFADVAKGGLPGLAAAAGASGAGQPAKSDTAKTKVSNEYMCDGFQQMFKEHQKTYGEVVFNSLGKYFQDAPSKAKLTAMLEQNIGQYIQSPQFRGTTAAVIKEAIGSVMRESLKTELKNPANFTGMCGEIQKLAMQRRGGGGSTRTKRKPRKKTIKRRN
jgi:hypothetical protein